MILETLEIIIGGSLIICSLAMPCGINVLSAVIGVYLIAMGALAM